MAKSINPFLDRCFLLTGIGNYPRTLKFSEKLLEEIETVLIEAADEIIQFGSKHQVIVYDLNLHTLTLKNPKELNSNQVDVWAVQLSKYGMTLTNAIKALVNEVKSGEYRGTRT